MLPPLQIVVNGAVQGINIGVLALAFAIVFATTRVFHLAFVGTYALPPFVLWAALHAGMGWPEGIIMALIAGTILGLLCEGVNHSRLARVGASEALHLIASAGVLIIIVQAVALIWGNEAKTIHPGTHNTFQIGHAVIARSQVINMFVSLFLIAIVLSVIHRTNLGLRLRALAENPAEVALSGTNVAGLRYLVFGLSGFLAAAGALLNAYDVGFDPYVGMPAFLLAVTAAVIGGRQTFIGPVVGGLILGLMRSTVVWYTSPRWQDAITFMVLACFLVARPTGIFGRSSRLEAEL